VESCSSTAKPTKSPSSVVQRGLDDNNGLMGSRRVGALSGAMVVSMADLVRSLLWSNTLEMVGG
jgi:hypothetical protein